MHHHPKFHLPRWKFVRKRPSLLSTIHSYHSMTLLTHAKPGSHHHSLSIKIQWILPAARLAREIRTIFSLLTQIGMRNHAPDFSKWWSSISPQPTDPKAIYPKIHTLYTNLDSYKLTLLLPLVQLQYPTITSCHQKWADGHQSFPHSSPC